MMNIGKDILSDDEQEKTFNNANLLFVWQNSRILDSLQREA